MSLCLGLYPWAGIPEMEVDHSMLAWPRFVSVLLVQQKGHKEPPAPSTRGSEGLNNYFCRSIKKISLFNSHIPF